MKSTECVKKYDSEVRLYTNYAIKHIKTICKSFGPRPVGSDAEKQAQEYMLKELDTTCDSAKREEFKCSDKAFMAWVPLCAALLILSNILLTLGVSVASLVLSVLAIFFIAAEFIFYKPVLDVFFPKKTSGNVIGVRKASGETKKRIVLSGHTDSAFEWTYTYHGGRPMVAAIIANAGISIVLHIGVSIYALITNDGIIWTGDDTVLKVLICICYATMPLIICAFFFVNYKNPVPGANDNMSGTLLSMAVLKFLDANDIRFENTEVVGLLVGGEEAGLRGSKAWAAAHADEIRKDKENGIETVFLAIDTIREPEFMAIYNKDMTGVVKNSQEVSELVQTAAKNVGFDVPIKTIELGATDAAAVSQAEIPASSFTAMDPSPARYYHTRLDTEDNLNPKALETGLKIALETVFLFDEKGI